MHICYLQNSNILKNNEYIDFAFKGKKILETPWYVSYFVYGRIRQESDITLGDPSQMETKATSEKEENRKPTLFLYGT